MDGHSSRPCADLSAPGDPGLERKRSWMPGSSLVMTTYHKSSHGHFLQIHQPRHALARQLHQRKELVLREWRLFGGALHFDDSSVARHDEIRVGFGLGILGIIEIEHRHAIVDAAGDRSHIVAQYIALDHVAGLHPSDAIRERDPGAGYRGCPRAAIG